ncbi:MAG: alkaline shock response membrane anchor protein AmaP [Actinomycetota bacterium]|nr:alkaline shock response membrane anchor protein AmaP [Actinomycetota bacterium]
MSVSPDLERTQVITTGHLPDAPATDALPTLPEPAHRGTTTVRDTVVAKLAAVVVTEVDRASGAPRTMFGQALGAAKDDAAPRTSATVDGQTARVKLSMAVRYPSSVVDVCATVRREVMTRVQELTGLTVAQVDIDVPALVTTTPRTARVR